MHVEMVATVGLAIVTIANDTCDRAPVGRSAFMTWTGVNSGLWSVCAGPGEKLCRAKGGGGGTSGLKISPREIKFL